MQRFAHFAAERPRAHRRQTDGYARLRNQRKAEIIANAFPFARQQRANVSARVFTGNAPCKIEQPHQQQRHASACTQCIRQRAEVETQAGTHKKKQQNRRAPIAQLAKEFLVFRQVDIGHAHGHAAQQRRNIRHGTDAAERKQRRNGNNQTVIF